MARQREDISKKIIFKVLGDLLGVQLRMSEKVQSLFQPCGFTVTSLDEIKDWAQLFHRQTSTGFPLKVLVSNQPQSPGEFSIILAQKRRYRRRMTVPKAAMVHGPFLDRQTDSRGSQTLSTVWQQVAVLVPADLPWLTLLPLQHSPSLTLGFHSGLIYSQHWPW